MDAAIGTGLSFLLGVVAAIYVSQARPMRRVDLCQHAGMSRNECWCLEKAVSATAKHECVVKYGGDDEL